MPPKTKITKNQLVTAAVDIVRRCGMQALNARSVALALDCSTQPVFSNFATMAQLRLAVVERAEAMCDGYIRKEVAKGEYPEYKASGMAYIRFAKEEKELFKLLYMRDRRDEWIPEETEQTNKMHDMVHSNTGLSGMESKLFHLEMWTCVHGIATMFATDYLQLDWDLVSKILTDTYQGLKKQYAME